MHQAISALKKGLSGCSGGGTLPSSMKYSPNRLMCSVRYGLNVPTKSEVTAYPSCRISCKTSVISTTLCSIMALAIKSLYLMRFSYSRGSRDRMILSPPKKTQPDFAVVHGCPENLKLRLQLKGVVFLPFFKRFLSNLRKII